MNFRTGNRDEPEINLIAFIDILLVVLIFLMLTTTYSKFTEFQVNLPMADAQVPPNQPAALTVIISRDGRYAINNTVLESADIERLTQALAMATQGHAETTIVISADASATHQSVMNVMDAARRNGLVKIHFTTQQVSTKTDKP